MEFVNRRALLSFLMGLPVVGKYWKPGGLSERWRTKHFTQQNMKLIADSMNGRLINSARDCPCSSIGRAPVS